MSASSFLFKRSALKALVLSLILSLLLPLSLSPRTASAIATLPFTLKATEYPDQIAKLSWTSTSFNVSTRIYDVYYLGSDDTWTLLAANITGTSYTTPSMYDGAFTNYDASDGYFSYDITSVWFKVVAKAIANPLSIKTSQSTTPTPLALTGGRGNPVSNGIQLFWDAIPGTSGYYVYGSSEDGSLTGSPKATGTNTFISTATIIDHTPQIYKPNKTYYFRIGAIGENGHVTVLPQIIAVNTGKQNVMFQVGLSRTGYGPVRINDTPFISEYADYIQAVKIKLSGNPYLPPNAGITYLAHIQDYGWTGQGWMSNGVGAGTENQKRRLEAIQIKLVNMPGVHVEYRACVEGYGWQPWVRDGATAGTTGLGRMMYDLQIRLVYD